MFNKAGSAQDRRCRHAFAELGAASKQSACHEAASAGYSHPYACGLPFRQTPDYDDPLRFRISRPVAHIVDFHSDTTEALLFLRVRQQNLNMDSEGLYSLSADSPGMPALSGGIETLPPAPGLQSAPYRRQEPSQVHPSATSCTVPHPRHCCSMHKSPTPASHKSGSFVEGSSRSREKRLPNHLRSARVVGHSAKGAGNCCQPFFPPTACICTNTAGSKAPT